MADVFENGLVQLGIGTKVGEQKYDVDTKFGILDQNLKVKMDFNLDQGIETYDMNEGRVGFVLNGKIGYMDDKGDVVIPPQFDNIDTDKLFSGRIDAGNFYDGLAEVVIGKLHGFIDLSGKIVIPTIYLEVQTFDRKGIAEVKTQECTWIKINRKGEKVGEGTKHHFDQDDECSPVKK